MTAHVDPMLDRVLVPAARALIGTPYDLLDCWHLAADLYARRDVILSENWMSNMIGPQRKFDSAMVGDFSKIGDAGFWPQPWDLVVIRNHEYLPSHVGVVIDRELTFVHSMEDVGVVCSKLDQPEFRKPRRIVAFARLRETSA